MATEKQKPEQAVTMRVRVGDREIEVTGPPEFVEKKIEEFLEVKKGTGIQRSPADAGVDAHPSAVRASSTVKSQSMAQFFKKFGPKSDVDRVLFAGYYLESYQNTEKFTAAEIREAIRGAKHPPPKNTSDAIAQNIRKGLMMAAGDKEGKIAYVLTSDGEEKINESIIA
jgi:hypothetical protein